MQELKKAHLKQVANELEPWQAHDAEIVECEKTLAKKSRKPLMKEPGIRRHWEAACSRSLHICES